MGKTIRDLRLVRMSGRQETRRYKGVNCHPPPHFAHTKIRRGNKAILNDGGSHHVSL